ncbi:MAG TPA: FtsX-like permease family protein, partial [Nocardioides sp.]|uniref:ABC transporter permease n=1 Tax=Nocardioides sp. TaxID=35761 RepID=UPI002D7F9EE1
TLTLVTPGTPPTIEAELTGIVEFGAGGLNGATLTLLDLGYMQRQFFGGRDVYNAVSLNAAEGVTQEELAAAAQEVLPDGVVARTGDVVVEENQAVIDEILGFLNTFLLVFAGVSLVVGTFLIVNTFSILVAQRSRELALLRAIGASRRQVTRSVMFEAVVLGAVGSTIGLGLGVLLAMGIRALFATFGLDLSGSDLIFAARTPLAAYAVGILVTLVAAYIPARRSARIPPIAALRDDVAMPESALHWRLVFGTGLIVAGAGAMLAGLYVDVPRPGWWVGGGILAALLGVAAASPVISRPVVALATIIYRRVYGTVGNLAGQNSLRNPRRTSATASALMIGLALVTTMSILGSSAKDSVDKTIEESFYADLVVSNVIGVPFSPSIANRIERTDGIAEVSRLRYANASFDGDGQGVMGIEAESLVDQADVPMVEGSLTDLRDGTMLVSDSRAEEDGLAVGDEVTMTFPTGKRDLEVVGIYQTDNNTVLFYPFTTTLDTLADAGFPEADNYLLISTEEGADTAAVQRTLEKQTAELPTVTVKDQAGFAEEQRAPIDQMLLLIYALLGLALVIAVLGIVNTLALSVIERTREVGLLRAIGLGRGQLRRMIRLEAIVIAVLGAVLGVGMGIVFGLALMTSLADDGLEVITVPGWQLAGYVLAAGFVGVLAAVFPARRAARLDVLQAIATE